MKIVVLLLGLLSITACTSPEIKARSFYTSRKDLASYMLDTPDPDKTSTELGQVIWVRWFCPTLDPETVIDATLRFKDFSERHQTYPVQSRYGWLMIEVPSNEYAEKGGIIGYDILLRRGEDTLASTAHKL